VDSQRRSLPAHQQAARLVEHAKDLIWPRAGNHPPNA